MKISQNIIEQGNFFLWKNIHTLPSRYIQAWQKMKLKHLLRHAYANTLFYREMWNAHGVSPDNVRSIDDLSKFPVINKQTFRNDDIKRYTHLPLSAEHYYWMCTSGSTGEPFQFVTPRYGPAGIEPPHEDFHSWRFLVWNGVSFSDILNKMKILEFRLGRSSTRHLRPFLRVDDLYQNTDYVLESVQKYAAEVDVIGSYSSVLVEFARIVRDRGLSISFKYAVGYGDVLSDVQRSFIEETFGCEMYDQYSTEEFWMLGTECKEHEGFHLNSETYIVEIVDEVGKRVPDGHRGRVVITSLFNYSMPFIRYAIGDYGAILPGECRCGLKTPRLCLDGREGFFLQFPSLRIHYYYIVHIMLTYFSKPVLEYQLRKSGKNKLEILVVPHASFNTNVKKEITDRVQKLLGESVEVSVCCVDSIQRTSSGKRLICVDAEREDAGI